MQIKKNDIIELNIDSCTLDGNGIGRFEGLAVFVPRSAPGDLLKVRILKVKKNCAYGKIEEIITASDMRISPDCSVYTRCGGCSFCHIDYDSEATLKEKHVHDCFERIAKIDLDFEPIIKPETISRYRNKAQYPLEDNGGEIKTGFYSRHSHRVIDCPDCILQPEEFNTILEIIKKHIIDNKISIYNETTGKGLLRHIYIRKGTASGEIMVCPVINGDKLPGENVLSESLIKAVPEIRSIIININKSDTNVILGKTCRTVYGKDYITDTLCGLKFRLSPLSFYQVNRDQAEKLYNKVREYCSLTGNETVMDLYCGTGTIGLSLAGNVKRLIGVEIVEQAVADAKINAEINGIGNSEFICSDASEAAEKLASAGIQPDIVILDPPRKGCSGDLIKTVSEMNPERIVYVSCDPATLARDCALFTQFGFIADKAVPVDMFARTGHVETVVRLIRQ